MIVFGGKGELKISIFSNPIFDVIGNVGGSSARSK
jgi:hypothetical protein